MIRINIISDTSICYDNNVSWNEVNIQKNISTACKSYYHGKVRFHSDYNNLWGFREVLYSDDLENLHYIKQADLYYDKDSDHFDLSSRECFTTSILNNILKTKLGPMAREYLKTSRATG